MRAISERIDQPDVNKAAPPFHGGDEVLGPRNDAEARGGGGALAPDAPAPAQEVFELGVAAESSERRDEKMMGGDDEDFAMDDSIDFIRSLIGSYAVPCAHERKGRWSRIAEWSTPDDDR